MNAKLKKLEALEKLLPTEPCTHHSVVVQLYGDAESKQHIEALRAERQSCVRCHDKTLVILLSFCPSEMKPENG